MNDHDLLESAGSELDRILGFFPRVDAKASVVLAVNTGMLGFLAAHVPALDLLTWWEIAIAAASVVLIGISLCFLYHGAFPNIKGGASSLVYFREIAKRTEAKFIDEFAKQTMADHARDLLGQTWRNSEILEQKFDDLKLAFIFLALAIPAWAFSLVIFSIKAASQIGTR